MPAGEPAPAAVQRRDGPVGGEQHRQAVGDEHERGGVARARSPGRPPRRGRAGRRRSRGGPSCRGPGGRRGSARAGRRRRRRAASRLASTLARVVVGQAAEVERRERAGRDAAAAGGEQHAAAGQVGGDVLALPAERRGQRGRAHATPPRGRGPARARTARSRSSSGRRARSGRSAPRGGRRRARGARMTKQSSPVTRWHSVTSGVRCASSATFGIIRAAGPDAQDHAELVAERARVDVGVVAADHAGLLEPPEPLADRRRGQPDAPAQLGEAQRARRPAARRSAAGSWGRAADPKARGGMMPSIATVPRRSGPAMVSAMATLDRRRAPLADRVPPHAWFVGSAVFHYLGPGVRRAAVRARRPARDRLAADRGRGARARRVAAAVAAAARPHAARARRGARGDELLLLPGDRPAAARRRWRRSSSCR